VAVTSFVLFTSWAGTQYAWGSPTIVSLIIVSVVAGAAFVFAEWRAEEPLVPLHLFRDRNFDLSTIGGVITAIAMFGVIGYMPSYLQMVTGLGATKAALLLVPMVFGMMGTGIGSGLLASRTGRYKWMPVVGSLVVGAGLALLSTLAVGASLWTIGAYLFIVGVGLGLGMQILVLVVQNSFPIAEVGTATGANSFFREIGMALGSAIVGTLFTNRLLSRLTEGLGSLQGAASGASVNKNSITPALVQQLPTAVKDVIVNAYNSALTPVYLYLVPLMIAGAVLLLFIKEKPLAQTNAESGMDLSDVESLDDPSPALVTVRANAAAFEESGS
jgi:predicted MFS family arabinose efflux permease